MEDTMNVNVEVESEHPPLNITLTTEPFFFAVEEVTLPGGGTVTLLRSDGVVELRAVPPAGLSVASKGTPQVVPFPDPDGNKPAPDYSFLLAKNVPAVVNS